MLANVVCFVPDHDRQDLLAMAQVSYVWAQHDFVPEHDDELEFRAGDRIEIMERDELYGDGWWQGRVHGKTGLFPEAYTTREPPVLAHGGPLHALAEEASDEEGERPNQRRGDEMAATLTDVQAAIEQLGVRGAAGASRSFSFASTRTGETESEPDADDEDGSWHRNARTALAAAAAKSNSDSQDQWNPPPPIALEMSDESDDDEDHHIRGNDLLARAQSPHTHTPTRSPQYVVPSPSDPDRPESPPLTAVATTFKGRMPASPPRSQTPRATSPLGIAPISPKKPLVSRAPSVPPLTDSPEDSPFFGSESESHTPAQSTSVPFAPVHSLAAALRSASPAIGSNPSIVRSSLRSASPAPAHSTASLPTPVTPTLARSPAPSVLSFTSGRHVDRRSSSSSPYPPPTDDLPALPLHMNGSTASVYTPSIAPRELSNTARKYTGATIGLPSPATSASGTAAAPAASLSPTSTRFRQASTSSDAPTPTTTPPTVSAPFSQTPATQWTVPQVIAWLQSKGFDNEIQRGFQDNDITGDVLIELDGPALKDELGVTAFGKRMRLLKQIGELKREDEKAKEREKQSSKESSKEKLVVGSRWSGSSRPTSAIGDDDDRLKVRPTGTRPTSLVLSPSDGAIATRGFWDSARASKDERGVLSEGESTRKTDITKAKQFFDQPQSQPTPTTTIKTDTKTDPSEAGSTPISSFPPSPSFRREKPEKEKEKEKEKDVKSVTGSEGATSPGHAKKRSIDTSSVTGGARDRLSIFGSALGKGRKPAPRYSASETGAVPAEERSHRSLSRLYMGSGSQRKSKVPPSPGTTSTENEARKRTISGPVGPLRSASPAGGFNVPNRSPVIPTRNLSNNPHHSAPAISPVANGGPAAGARALDQIGEPDYSGWMRKKGDRYNSWKLRYFVLKGPHLYYLRSRTETKIKGYVDITGYKVIADENANPGRYGFRIVHDTAKPHFFSSEEQVVVREWMKALMKATILRNYNDPVRSSCNVPTIPLAIAQQMNPAPRPPSPSEREAAQRASRRENPNQLSSRDARILMGLPENGPPPRDLADQHRMNSFFVENGQEPILAETEQPMSPVSNAAPTRPSREMRPRVSKTASRTSALSSGEQELVEWVNSKLPPTCPLVDDLSASMASGLVLFRLAEAIKEVDSGVSDSVFPQGPGDDRLDGLFKLFDFLLDNDVRMGAVSINDVRNGNAEKIAQLVRALKVWDDKRRTSGKTKSSVAAGPWMGMSSY
ncbi:SH3 domain-binding protein 2 pleckstrin-like (PH) domain protein [Rhizoctonia solani 123E]|uniref:SH3 domain-binding protein 2 pleckstrin-like (PH) domain protein n=1 Tax=Rhizoctonia solani 123E TaxID=1423351 RepID=A0A074RVM3_9AGAM|nr:SH3 domain-binding protein 2 pleckstrin-like (PH) domain protein [Rhizoctonia solani 123E]